MVGTNTQSTDASFLRKLRKPMVEKKRRDRMNVSIDNLKALLAKSSKNATSVVKMDKAEILELAVSHLTQLQHKPKSKSVASVASYRAGFRACTKETIRYLNSSARMPNPLLQDLDNHLNVCETTSHQRGARMSPAVFLPDRNCTSSPVLDSMPPMPRFSPFCGGGMFSPISSVDIRGHVMHSPVDNLFVKPASRPCSPCSTSPALSSCSFSTTDSSSSPLSVRCMDTSRDTDESADSMDSKNDIISVQMIKTEKPWRPW